MRDLLATLPADGWTLLPAAYGQGEDAIAGQLVIGRGLPVLAWQQRDNGRARARQRRQRARAHNAGYARKDRPTAAAATDAWVVLFTTETTVLGALRRYQPRYGTEGTYRDLQSGAFGDDWPRAASSESVRCTRRPRTAPSPGRGTVCGTVGCTASGADRSVRGSGGSTASS